jgi:hypothetical protein
MRRSRILRTRPAAQRVLAAAVVSTVLLFPAGADGAAPGTRRSAWTTAWANHELQLHFDATIVACLPLGRAVVVDGARKFREFVCGLVLADGSRYSIRLQPVSRTTWTVESMKRLGSRPAADGGLGSPANRPPKKKATNSHADAPPTTASETTTDTTAQPAAPGGANSGGKGNSKKG